MAVMTRIVPGDELKRVADALRQIDATLPAKLRRRLKRGVDATVKDVKQHVRTIPVARKSNRNRGLRRRIARGVTVQIGTGRFSGTTYMRIITTMPSKQQAMLPRGLDALYRPHGGWTHPVFERPAFEMRAQRRKRVMVRQFHPQSGWFREEISEHREAIAEELAKALDEARDIIAKAAMSGRVALPTNWQ